MGKKPPDWAQKKCEQRPLKALKLSPAAILERQAKILQKKQLMIEVKKKRAEIFTEPGEARLADSRNMASKNDLKVVTDFGGMEGGLIGLKRVAKKYKLTLKHLSSSDEKPYARRWIKCLSPECEVLEDATKRDLKQTPDHDVYSACWQCQPYCQGGKGEGVKDKKGRGAPNIVATLRLIKAKKTKMFVSENSPNLVAPKHIDVTLKVVRTLREQNYRVFC